MSLTLYSPNLGADGVTGDVHAILNSYGTTRLPELEIEVLKGDADKREAKANAFRLAPSGNLFMVERLRMPNPNGDGARVLVYKTTVRIGKKTYSATCYTNHTVGDGPRIFDLTPDELMKIGEHVGKTTTPGVWQSLLQVERLKRFRFS